ncbi:MAG: hypothetical protein NC340_05855 [Ruminococcus flavefaciens]|nr:hypothetical protein [Ruminococcus flavefaciens]MCM1231193.1 hypothetical protein [Ruminococcus flavefaciens]
MKKIIKIIMMILTLIYPVFMTCLAGAGLIYNKSGYGAEIALIGIFLIISGILMTVGAVLCLSGKKLLNIISLACSVLGLALCLAMLYLLCTHADNAGWSDNYTMNPVSAMYRARILPVIFPSAISAGIAITHIKQNRTS